MGCRLQANQHKALSSSLRIMKRSFNDQVIDLFLEQKMTAEKGSVISQLSVVYLYQSFNTTWISLFPAFTKRLNALISLNEALPSFLPR